MALPRFGNWTRPVPVLNVAVDEGDGPVVILVHGIASSSRSWAHVVPLLSPLYRVISIDLLGFGNSIAPPDATFTLEEHVAALRATIRSLKIRGQITLVGHSLGAFIISRYAAIYRHDVAQVLLVAPPLYPESEYITEFGAKTVVKSYLKFYKYLRSNKSSTQRNLNWLSRWLPHPLLIDEQHWNAFALSMEHCIEGQTTVTDIAQITAPVDVIYGARDQIVLESSMRRLSQLQHVTVHEVPKNDHLVRMPIAREIARLIR